MSNQQSLCCDACGTTHFEIPIIEKPKRFALKSKIHDLTVSNTDGRATDNICLECLTELIDNYGI
ncbi:hypothetical protein [Lysinibacillus sp. LZ02]|uniref:hypothetical protein n=1 Tax=Lysinibacillus sp. LZ02 TaxID=3420668 RepID=UPI003D35B12A